MNSIKKEVVYVSSNISHHCEYCDRREFIGGENFTDSINHYIQNHGFELIHVGQESVMGSDGKQYQTTVAILGHSNPPKKNEIPSIPMGM